MCELGDEPATTRRPEVDHLMGAGTEGENRLDLRGREHIEKLVPPVLDTRRGRDLLGLGIDLPFSPYRNILIMT